MQTSLTERFASVAVGLESLGLAILVGWQLVAMVSGDTESATTAIALIVMTAIGAAAVAAFAVAIWRGVSWGRSGGIVVQVLLLAVALGAATGTYAEPSIGLVLAIPAAAIFVLLVVAVRAAGRRTRDDEKQSV